MGSSEFGEDSFGTGKPGYASFEPGHHSLEEFVDDLVYGECYATFPEDGCCDGHSLSHGRAGVLGVPFFPCMRAISLCAASQYGSVSTRVPPISQRTAWRSRPLPQGMAESVPLRARRFAAGLKFSCDDMPLSARGVHVACLVRGGGRSLANRNVRLIGCRGGCGYEARGSSRVGRSRE